VPGEGAAPTPEAFLVAATRERCLTSQKQELKSLAGGKWIEGLTPFTPLDDAARRVLSVRLEVVRHHLTPALREPEKDTEHVHQLRVGTRRTRAALDIFASCLPARVCKKARKKLRSLRQAAGAARDWDVFLKDLEDWAAHQVPHRPSAGLDFLRGYATGQRLAAQVTLEQAVPDDYLVDRFAAELLHEVRCPEGSMSTLLDLACPSLLALVAALDQAAADPKDSDNLHQVRIAGKRLRYAMEVFAGCFAEEFRTVHYSTVEEMQEILGAANDSHVACQRLELLRVKSQSLLPHDWERIQPNLDALLQHHRQHQLEQQQRFVAWWRRWQESGGKTALLALLKSVEQVNTS
jgi:CHAD domain-containing protein